MSKHFKRSILYHYSWLQAFFDSAEEGAGIFKEEIEGNPYSESEIKGGVERGRKFSNALKVHSLTADLGDVRSITTHPASTSHSKLPVEEH